MVKVDTAYVAFNIDYTRDSRKAGKVDQRITTCTDCRKGIFPSHTRVWTNRGLVHTECNNEINNAT